MKKTVMILFGGQSSEHEVSCVSASNVLANIDRDLFNVVPVGITMQGEWYYFNGPIEKMKDGSWVDYCKENDVKLEISINSPRDFVLSFAKKAGYDEVYAIFPVMHGINAEDGTLQGLLELCQIPYVGPGVLGSAMSMDKEISKIIFENAGIPQGRFICVKRNDIEQAFDEIEKRVQDYIKYPCFIKPANAGSSVGVNKAKNADELRKALQEAARFDKKLLIEEFINGREIECAVLGNDNPKAAPTGEIVANSEFYDYNAKYIDNKSYCVIPAEIDKEIDSTIRAYAIKAYEALNCSGLSRVDFFLDRDTNKLYINEINTLPGFTNISMYPKMWDNNGIKYKELITLLMDYAVERMEDNKKALS